MLKKIFKLITFLLISLSFLFFTKSIEAFQFKKSSDNPLSVSYINSYENHLQVNLFKEGDIYKGIFAINRPPEAYYSLGYFESNNGINWQMKKEILNTGVDLSNPRILKTPTGYLLFITRFENNVIYKIYSSSCDFNFNCSSNFVPVIIPDVNNNSENKGVFAGNPFNQNNRTYLFFGAWGGDGFKIKLAYSDDLVNWQRCPNDKAFLYGGDDPFPYIKDSDLYLFFHRSDSSGIKVAKTSLPLTCDSVFEDQGYLLIRDKSYDQKHLIFPSLINDNNGLKLYYTGLGNDSLWRLNLALEPTMTPTPSPVAEKVPIIIIPGFMASWNKRAILHNDKVSYKDWKLQSFVKEYDGLINTLINIGYEKNSSLFLFSYDWRQPIEADTDDLKDYLQEKIWDSKPNQKIDIIGHSLGGLIGRVFTQKNKDKVNQIISVGSPHQGAVQVYKPLEAGEVDRDNTFLWLAEKIILVLNKSTVESDRVTIANKFPVAKDLFPTFNFLKDSKGNEISVDSLTIKNTFLSLYNLSFSDIFSMFTSIYGDKNKNTLAGYTVEPQNSLDKLFGNYSDGKPKESYFDSGDYTVLSKSASQDTDSEKLDFDHSEIVTKNDAVKKILNILNIQYQDSQIVESKRTIISPSLIFLIKSPATMTVEHNNELYFEDEGIIFIPDAQSDSYKLKVHGIDQGKYEVIVGQISESNDIWESINGEITQSPASSQVDDYDIQYNNQTALSIIPPTSIPTVISTSSPTPTSIPTATTTPTSTIVPTSTPQLISSIASSLTSSNNEIPISRETFPEVLGTSSNKVESIMPTVGLIKKAETKKKINRSSIWDYFWPSITSLILGGIGYLFKKKILKK